MNHITDRLVNCIKSLSSNAIGRLFVLALEMIDAETAVVDKCPYCGSASIMIHRK